MLEDTTKSPIYSSRTFLPFDHHHHGNNTKQADVTTTSSASSADSQSNNKLLSGEAAFVFQLLFLVLLGGLVGLVGIFTNILNIVVFVKQGAYNECGNVSLLGLAVADLLVTSTMLYASVVYSFVLVNPPRLPWVPFDLVFLTAGVSHLTAAQLARIITAYVAFERCVCVALPFKVKTLLTPRRSAMALVCAFLCATLTKIPVGIKYRLQFRFDPVANMSRLTMIATSDIDIEVIDIMWYISSMSFNIAPVVIVFVCTLITVGRVKLSKSWRNSMVSQATTSTNTSAESNTKQTSQAGGNNNNKSARQTESSTRGNYDKTVAKQNPKAQKEEKLINMIVSISVIFMVCYLPDLAYLLMYSIDENISTKGKYNNLAISMYSMTIFMETFNSSINIVVYYRLSSKYKTICRQLLGRSNDNNTKL